MNNAKKKIIVTGNPNYGLAHSISAHFQADFYSRSNGFDLSNTVNQKRFAHLSLQYDVFINCASLKGFNQTQLLKEVYQTWRSKGHKGYIINIGSSSQFTPEKIDWTFPAEKSSLKTFSESLCLDTLGSETQKASGIKITHLAPGNINIDSNAHLLSESKSKLEPDYIANLIKWLINQPDSVNINELSVDPIPSAEIYTNSIK